MCKKIIELKELMEEISERCCCASWMVDLEFTLWKFVQEALKDGFQKDKEWGQNTIKSFELNKLWNFAHEVNGWWIFNLETEKDEQGNFKRFIGWNGEAFVLLKDWEEYFAKNV
jgi:hypothetical protein